MRDLTVSEVEQVSGAFIPAAYGALVIGARLVANPAVRQAAVSGAKWFGNAVGGGIVGGSSYAAYNSTFR